MLTIEELRQALGRPELTDAQVAEVRDFLYGLANMLIDDYLAGLDYLSTKKR
jgi:hypothetical protein